MSFIKTFTFTCLSLILAATLEAGNLHLILIGDFESDDKYSKEIISKDLDGIQREGHNIASMLNLPVQETILLGSINAIEALKQIDELNIESDDIIVFYFSGHGFSLFSQVNDNLPDLYFSEDSNAFALSDLIIVLKSKNAQFTFIFVDCCNNLIPDGIISPLLKPVLYEPLDILKKTNYQRLFFGAPRFVVLCATKKTQLAHSQLSKGSFCTFALLETLHEKVCDPNLINWQDLLNATAAKVRSLAKKIGKRQSPKYHVE